MRNSQEVVSCLKDHNSIGCPILNADIVDLFHSIHQIILLQYVKECITKDNSEDVFINNCGISVSSFVELLLFSLDSTFVSRGGVSL